MQNPLGKSVFRGQQPDESVVLLAHEHWLLLAKKAWQALLALVVCVVLLFWHADGAFVFVAGVAALGLLARWLAFDVYSWWQRLYIITTRRVVLIVGVVRQQMNEIPLRNVQSVNVTTPSLDEWFFGYGRIDILAAGGGGLRFAGIPRPQTIAALITQARDNGTPGHTQPQPAIADPLIRQKLDMLAQPDDVPMLIALDPACTRQWPLSRAVNVTLDANEMVLGIVSRHWWALVRPTVVPLALVFVAIGLFAEGFWRSFSGLELVVLALTIGLIWLGINYLNFADDIFIFTSRRIIDVQRLYFILYATNISIEYEKIQEITTTVPTYLARLLHFGTLTINTAGTSTMILDQVPAPKAIEASIERNRIALKQRAEVLAANKEKQRLKEWFAVTLGEMIVVAPDVVGLPRDQAIDEVQRAGLRPILLAFIAQQVGIPQGVVMSQSPAPGSRALYGSDISLMFTR